MLVPNNDITFSFTGKERDSETGYGYFGARYMDHELMAMWLSVDPLADKYPSISPYAYCAWNPVKLVDPDGMEICDDWYRNRVTGSVVWMNSNERTLVIEGEEYENIGEDYSYRAGNNIYLYHQNQCVSVTEYVLSPNDFRTQMNPDGTKRGGDNGNCFNQSGTMVAQSGTQSLNGTGNNITDIKEGIDYINNQIDQGFSVRVQVDRENKENKMFFDGKGDHWVAISSRTISFIDGFPVSYGFYDPATYFPEYGISNSSQVTPKGLMGRSSYNEGKNNYLVIAVRKNVNNIK